MANDYSFDITCDYDHQEMVNTIDQTKREIENRFDFKGVVVEIDLNDKEKTLTIKTESDYKLESIVDIIESKMIKRNLSLLILDKTANIEASGGNTVKKIIKLKSGLSSDDAKKISKIIRDEFPKSKPVIQGESVRVTSKSKDELQSIMVKLKSSELKMPLEFGNYR